MIDRWLKLPAHYYLHFIGALLIAVGLPLNKVVMSIGSIWLISNILLEGNLRTYWSNLKISPLFISVVIIFFLHIIGLIWTTDFDFAASDIRKKLPFFILPLALIAKPISQKQVTIILYVFLAVVFLTSVINLSTFYRNGYFSDGTDLRYITLPSFGSHIRHGLLVVMALTISTFTLIPKKATLPLGILLSLWFIFYLMIGQVLSANFALLLLSLVLLIYWILHLKNTVIRYSALTMYIGGVFIVVLTLSNYLRPNTSHLNFSHLPSHSRSGNPYYHDTLNLSTENGFHIMSMIQEEELRDNWENSSTIPYDSLDKKGQLLMGTLIRYMTSKGITKDAEGFKMLTKMDVHNIESGIPSIRYSDNRFSSRIDGLQLQLQNYYSGGNSSGHSLLQRFEHWRAAKHIIQSNWLWGVGTGDLDQAFQNAYKEIGTDLEEDKWARGHNQYLTFWATFGILGLLSILFYSVELLRVSFQTRSILGVCFSVIAIASFLPEDTLETQQGVTFIAFFTGLLPLLGKGTTPITSKDHTPFK